MNATHDRFLETARREGFTRQMIFDALMNNGHDPERARLDEFLVGGRATGAVGLAIIDLIVAKGEQL